MTHEGVTKERPLRVTVPLVQLRSDYTPVGDELANRHYYRGDLLPPWVSQEERARLLAGGFIVEVD